MARQKGDGAKLFAPVLEFNPDHGLLKRLSQQLDAGGDRSGLEDMAWLLFDQALILDGELPADTAGFARRMAEIMRKGM